MQSLVVAFGVFFNQSINICSSSSPAGACAFRFFTFTGAPPVAFVGEIGSSVAFRLLLGFPLTPCDCPCTTGLEALLPPPGGPAVGLVARLPAPVRGLPERLGTLDFSFGAFGLVARLATTECPPWLDAGGFGEDARELPSGFTPGEF